MLEVKEFQHGQDIADFTSLLQARGLPLEIAEELPAVGYLVYDLNDLVAAGFLRRCEGSQAFIDGYFSHQDKSGVVRDKALNLLTDTLIARAKAMGIKVLLAWTSDENTNKRALKYGFKILPCAVMLLNVGNYS